MARRAGVVPFSLSNVTLDTPPLGQRTSPGRGHAHSHSHSSAHSHSHSHSHSQSLGSSSSRYSRPNTSQSNASSSNHMRGQSSSRTIAARRDSTPRSVPPASPSDGLALAGIGGSGMQMPMPIGRGGHFLPSVAEMTTGVSPYSTPAYSMSMSMGGGGYSSPGPMLPSLGMYSVRPDVKRRGSPDMASRETSRRRQ